MSRIGDIEREITVRIKLQEIRALSRVTSDLYINHKDVQYCADFFHRVLAAATLAENLPEEKPHEEKETSS